MLADMHRQAALDNEQAATLLGDPAARPFVRRAVIELYWGASFHWIAYGCQRKHGKQGESHEAGLVPARPGGSLDGDRLEHPR
jgi:hypothetical protein